VISFPHDSAGTECKVDMALKFPFTKMQGAGNDFVVVETGSVNTDWSRLAVAICDRHFGVGADGLLLYSPSTSADFKMRIFNADGSEARTCGNGIRCLVAYYVERQHVQAAEGRVTVETLSGVRDAGFCQTGGKLWRVRTAMGTPKLSVDGASPPPYSRDIVDITLSERCRGLAPGAKLRLDLISLGNAHAVIFTEERLTDFPLVEIGAMVRHELPVPGGVNLEVARVVNRRQIEARVLEAGVGETLSCGSGACAIGVAAMGRGLADHEVMVNLTGGVLEVEWDGMSEVHLAGPAETVFCGEWTTVDSGPAASISIKNEVMA
jgi:diaminopimelate epimerase